MRKLLRFLPFHFTVFLILGIYTQLFFEIWQFNFPVLLVFHGVFLLILVFLNQKQIRTFLVFSYFFFVGISTVFIQDDVNYSNYFSHFSKENSLAVLKIDKVLKSSSYHYKYQAKVIQIDQQKTKGIVLLNIEKESVSAVLKVDELIFAKASFNEINAPLNPHQFDYKNYLDKQGIRQQLFIDSSHFKSIGFGLRTFQGWSENFRDLVQSSLKKYSFTTDEMAVINALLLGERKEISKELLADYSKAGAIHILAVSGLHVGIILLLLLKLFSFLTYFKNGKIAQTILIILILWMFAFVAGLSASVVRAVTMFSFLAIGQQFGSKKVILFSLFSSLLILLIFKPLFLFDVGFQLSYLAVLGIITLQQKVYQLLSVNNKILNFSWQLTSVSIAAQIGVLPLSLYYFHQFPGLFFLSNIVIIPCLGFILMTGILIIFLSIFNVLPTFLANFYGFVISIMNGFVNWISNQEAFLFKDISLSFWLLLASYGIIFFSVRFLTHQTAKKALYVLGSFVVFQGVILVDKYQKKDKEEFLVFHKTKHSVFGFRNQNNIQFVHNTDSLQSINSITNSYKIGENIKESYKKMNTTIFQFNNQPILLIDSLGIYPLENLKNPIVILQNSPKLNVERMIKTLQPIKIIVDGSNFKTYASRWKVTSEKMKIPFHYTGENGAFILKN